MTDKKILVGMSGGVDSSVCAALLRQQGFTVGGITLNLVSGADGNNVADAKAICDSLGLEHITANLQNDFKTFVIDNFIFIM